MNKFLRGMTRAVVESFHLPEPILEIGSLQVEGASDDINIRTLFPGKDYTGVVFRAGPGVQAAIVGDLDGVARFAHASCPRNSEAMVM